MKLVLRILLISCTFAESQLVKADDSMLRVKCSGDDVGAAVSINGKFKGECPVDIPLQEGTYKLRVEKNDTTYDRSFEQDIRMGDGIVKKVEVELSKKLNAAGQKTQEDQFRQQEEIKRREAAAEKVYAQEAATAKINSIQMVRIPGKNYEIGKYEVTQSEWSAVMGSNPSKFISCGVDCPVEQINWGVVQEFIARLNTMTGKQYRLPSFEEWQEVCYGGRLIGRDYCGGHDLEKQAWYGKHNSHEGNSGNTTHPVGQKSPNDYGIYDMNGNVWEWISDCSEADCSKHSIIGGSWFYQSSGAHREGKNNSTSTSDIGFRLARTLPAASSPLKNTNVSDRRDRQIEQVDSLNIAWVNNIPISKVRMDLRIKFAAQQHQLDTPELRKAIRDDLINLEVLFQEASKNGIDNRPDVIQKIVAAKQDARQNSVGTQAEIDQQMKLAVESVVAGAYVQEYVKTHPISDEEMKKGYDKYKGTLGSKEYKISHILVASEGEAQSIIDEVRHIGSNFETIARNRSQDTGSKDNGGDLGWNVTSNFVKPFGDAILKLGKGDISPPVQTNFGWSVIKIDDVRNINTPEFEAARAQIESNLHKQAVQDQIKMLLSRSDIRINN